MYGKAVKYSIDRITLAIIGCYWLLLATIEQNLSRSYESSKEDLQSKYKLTSNYSSSYMRN